MSQLLDLIKQQVAEAATGGLSIPENLKEAVLGGVSDSIFDSVKQTAAEEGGLAKLGDLLTGTTSAKASPVTALASNLFTNKIAGKLGLSPSVTNMVVTFIPVVIEKLTKKTSEADGFEVSDLLSEFGGAALGDSLKKAAGSILGGLFK
ncbi:MAG: hypothetical protein E7099_03580 [Mediterranea massiliensis]|nr:hypothetical protein [Mediterranea massiliensis]